MWTVQNLMVVPYTHLCQIYVKEHGFYIHLSYFISMKGCYGKQYPK